LSDGRVPPQGQEAPLVADLTGQVGGGLAAREQGKAPDVTASSGLLEVVGVISASGPEVSRVEAKERGV